MRYDGRAADEMRPVELIRGYSRHAEGSCFIKAGNTHVLATASLEDRPPPWLRDTGKGWVTAEYGMLPRSTHSRMNREAARGGQSGRTQEIQRLIGRALRAVVDLELLGETQIRIDCDVIQADGGTRTASVTAAYVALVDCIDHMIANKKLEVSPLIDSIAAVSCGIVKDQPVLDLDYEEDFRAETDANFVLTGSGGIVEIQATAEEKPFSEEHFLRLLRLARIGCSFLSLEQSKVLQRLP